MQGNVTRTAEYLSPLGLIRLAANAHALTGLWFAGQKYEGRNLLPPETPSGILAEACCWLDAYFAGERPAADALPLDPGGSDFFCAVSRELRAIPYGETTTYGEIAKRIGRPKAAQAVGGAVGHNPISIIIPCHRVLGADRSLTGYAGGLDRKRFLLQLEGICFKDKPDT